MKCRKCGADLLDTDTFCVKCGQRTDGPMFCLSCGEELRDGERFCHKCGSPVESVLEDDEIPVTKQRTVDIPFDQIEQAILLEAEQAVVKRPDAERAKQKKPAEAGEERNVMRESPGRQMPPRPRREEAYDDYDEDGEDEEDPGSSRMKLVTVVLGIAVMALALAIGFGFWQRNSGSSGERPGEGTEQGGEPGRTGQDDDETGLSDGTQGRIQILSNVNVRNKPTTEGSEVLKVAKTGETYEYYELVDDAWYHIRLEDDKEGYVSAKYVEDLK